MLARDGRSKPCAVPGPASAGGCRRRSLHGAEEPRGAARSTERTGGSQATATATATPKPKRKRKVYVVKPGDTPSGIADKTGVSLEELEKANPKLDPQLLAPGQRIRLPQ